MKTYKCLAPNCKRKVEKKYLYCSLECGCYGGFVSGYPRKSKLQEAFRKVRRYIIYKIHMLMRIFV